MTAQSLRLSDEPVTKGLPSYIVGLPARPGERPRIEKAFPCLQATQVDAAAVHPDAITGLADGMPGVSVTAPRQTIPDARALVLAEKLALGQGEAFILGTEFAHVRRDGSVHLTLAPEWADEVIAKGWAQPHPLALYGLIAPQNVVMYAPRDSEELQVVRRVLTASYSFALGRVVDLEA